MRSFSKIYHGALRSHALLAGVAVLDALGCGWAEEEHALDM